MIPFIDLKTQYSKINREILSRIQSVLDHGQYIMGPEIAELENNLASYVGTKHCIGVSSGTDALLISLMALGVGKGDEVIVPDFSFFGTAEVISLLGAVPIFLDVEATTFNIDPSLIKGAITDRTKAIMPVSLYGQCADLDLINQVALNYDIAVIEDAAQSFGATYKGKRSCGLSTIGCTSFFPSKPLGGYGDGGACFTNNDELAQKIREMRIHGQSGRYNHTSIGINARLDSIQAAILLEKLNIFDQELKERVNIANYYTNSLNGIVETPFIEEHNTSAYAQYTIKVDNRDEFQKYLKEHEIPTAIHYPDTLSGQPVYRHLHTIDSPVARKLSKQVISLPMHPYLRKDQQDQIIDLIEKWYNR